MTAKENFLKGILNENPLFVSVLGTCPSLAITTSVENAIGMGVAVFFVLVLSNLFISLIMSSKALAELVKPVRIPVYIVVIALLVTLVQMVIHAYVPSLYKSLGVFIPLIVVNCIILGRAEAFASKNRPLASMIDGAGMAVGFFFALLILATIREVLGSGMITIWGSASIDLHFIFQFLHIEPLTMFVQPVGAFLTFGFVLATIYAIVNHRNAKKAMKGAESK